MRTREREAEIGERGHGRGLLRRAICPLRDFVFFSFSDCSREEGREARKERRKGGRKPEGKKGRERTDRRTGGRERGRRKERKGEKKEEKRTGATAV